MSDKILQWNTLDPNTLTQEQYGKIMAAALDEQIEVSGKAIDRFELPEMEHAALSAYIYSVANNGLAWDEIFYTKKWRGIPVERMVSNG